MGMVLPLYQPVARPEEIGMLDHLTGGRLEIGCASGVPQELIQVGLHPDENWERFIGDPGDSRCLARPAGDLPPR